MVNGTRGVARRRGGALAGCLIALGVVVVLVIAAVVFVAVSWRGWAAAGVEGVAVQAINDSDLDETEKGEVLAEIRAVTGAFKAGDITLAETSRIMEEVARSPIAPAAIVYGMNSQYFGPSGLSEEEKAAAADAMARVGRGVYEGTITPERLNAVFHPISTNSTVGPGVHINTDKFTLNLEDPAKVTDEQLREVVALAQAEAEAAQVPEEVEAIDPSEEIAKAVEKALGRRLTPAAP